MRTIKSGSLKGENKDKRWLILRIEDGDRTTSVWVAASYEYLWDLARTREITDEHVRQWMEKVREKWEQMGEEIFDEAQYVDIYAVTDEGYANMRAFLKTKMSES